MTGNEKISFIIYPKRLVVNNIICIFEAEQNFVVDVSECVILKV